MSAWSTTAARSRDLLGHPRDGMVWLVVDLDKPSAHRHALAMLLS
jgi:hypothetical protein